MKKEIPKKEQKEAKKEAGILLKDIEKKKCKVPKDEENILKWDIAELRAYITHKTIGLKPAKKIKFAKDLLKRIEEAKKNK